jgi:hypothetical protein
VTNHKQLLAAVLAAISLLFFACASTSASAPEAAFTGEDLPDSLFGPAPSEWAELHASDDAVVVSLDGYRLYWGPGSRGTIPSGKHTLIAGRERWADTVKLEYTFLPGKCYILNTNITGREETQSEIRTTAQIWLEEYGVTAHAVPAGDQSLLTFRLDADGSSYTKVVVDGRDYLLSAFGRDAAGYLRVLLPAGKHTRGAFAAVGAVTLDLPPNRSIS